MAAHRAPTRPPGGGHTPGLLLRAARARPAWLVVLTFAVVAETVATVVLPAALAAAVDGVLDPRRPDAVLGLVVVLAGFLIADTVGQLADAHYVADSTGWLRYRLLDHLLALGPTGTPDRTPGDLVGRLVGNAPMAAGGAVALLDMAARAATAVAALVFLALIDPRLLGVLLAGLPLALLILRAFVRDATGLVTDYQREQGALAGRLLDALAGLRTIRACGTMPLEIERVLGPLPRLARLGRALWRSQRRALWRSAPLVPTLQVAVLAMAGFGVAAGRLTPGQMLAAAAYTSLALGFLGNAEALVAWARARAGATRLTEVLAVPAPPTGTQPLPAGAGRLEFRGVTARRGTTTVLNRLDLLVPAGAAVAVVGASGAGKSTLAALAGGLRDPDAGRVWIDGVELAQLDPRSLRRAVTYAFEQPTLLGATVADAIGFGDDAPPRARIEAAARAARAEEFINRLPVGYDTPLHAAPLSGGEHQRLGLARALTGTPRLLILDDATSSLDTVTEAQIGAALAQALPGRTRLIVAHRATTAARCDLVAWLHHGCIRELGPHHQLWRDPDYRGLFHATRDDQP